MRPEGEVARSSHEGQSGQGSVSILDDVRLSVRGRKESRRRKAISDEGR
jgi:hypothetical protein